MFQVHVAVGVEDRPRHPLKIARHAQALQVHDADRAIVDNPPAGPRHPDAEIEVVAVHEERLVEHLPVRRHLREQPPRPQHEGPVDRADLAGRVVGQVREIVARQQFRPRKRRRQPRRPAEAVPQGRDRAPAGEVHGAIRQHQLRRNQAEVRFGQHPLHAVLDRGGVADRVGIEKQHAFARAPGVAEIVGGAEARVGRGGNIFHPGKLGLDQRTDAIRRKIVHDDHLDRPAQELTRQRAQRRPDFRARLVGHDDDGKERQGWRNRTSGALSRSFTDAKRGKMSSFQDARP